MIFPNGIRFNIRLIINFFFVHRIGEILPSPSTPRSVPFGTTRFNSLHVLLDSGQSWMDIQVCPLLLSWLAQSSASLLLSMFPSGSSPAYALAIPANGVHEAFYTSSALSSIVSSTPHGSYGGAIHPWFPSGFSCLRTGSSLSTQSYIS